MCSQCWHHVVDIAHLLVAHLLESCRGHSIFISYVDAMLWTWRIYGNVITMPWAQQVRREYRRCDVDIAYLLVMSTPCRGHSMFMGIIMSTPCRCHSIFIGIIMSLPFRGNSRFIGIIMSTPCPEHSIFFGNVDAVQST